MDTKPTNYLLVIALLLAVLSSLNLAAMPSLYTAETSVVQAILFYSPTCPHCHQVITEDLPPLLRQYGYQLVIAGVDVDTSQGQELYRTAVEHFAIPSDRIGVPTMIVGETVLVGADEIPNLFPGIVQNGLAKGGIAWPLIPGLSTSSLEPLQIQGLSAFEKFSLDPLANTLAVIILVGMLAGLTIILVALRKKISLPKWPVWSIPLITLVGIGVAGYLSYVEITQTTAICGPVGNCNLVQQSPYAKLLGIPVGILGIAGYTLILFIWLGRRFLAPIRKINTSFLIFAASVAGVVFSIYLTLLEPFVIGASCAWCLTSAVLMTLVMFAAAPEINQTRVARNRRAARRA